MARKVKIRYKRQGQDFLVGQLRKIAKDPETPAWLRVICLDRLAQIDGCYEVDLLPVTPRIAKLPRPPIGDIPTPTPTETEEKDIEGEQLLDEFNRRFYNKGEKK